VTLLIFIFLLCLSNIASAQLSGSIGIGEEATNNVQSLDTTAPDHLLMPAFQLNYDWGLSGVSKLSFSGGYAPSFYAVNPGLSFNETIIGTTGLFYLSNQDAIAAEADAKVVGGEINSRHSSHFTEGGYDPMNQLMNPFWVGRPLPIEFRPNNQTKTDDPTSASDSIVDLAVSALYTLSGQLDSTDISSQGISKAQVSQYEDLRDSISDVLSSVADILDSTGYSESVLEIVIPELIQLRSPMARLMPQTKQSNSDPKLLESAISLLKQAKPQADFLPSAPMPIGPSIQSATDSNAPPLKKPQAVVTNIFHQAPKQETIAPTITLISSSTRLRQFGYSDVFVREDADDSGATTLATSLTIPVSFSTHTGISYTPSDTLLFGGNYGGDPNDSRIFSFGAGIEGLPSANFSIRGSYDYTRTVYAFDSAYTNTENRICLIPRIAVTNSFVLFPEASFGIRNYLDPIHIIDTITRVVAGKKDTTTRKYTAGSIFTQFSFGLGGAGFLGGRWVVGALIAFNQNPNLRAYISTAAFQQVRTKSNPLKTVRPAVQIADDEYTYNLGRYSLFSNARIFLDIDLGTDFSYEHRLYGSAIGPKGYVLPGGQGRTEDCRFLNVSLSKLFPFDDNLAGVFNSLLLECLVAYSDVSASDPFYSYNGTNLTLTANLNF